MNLAPSLHHLPSSCHLSFPSAGTPVRLLLFAAPGSNGGVFLCPLILLRVSHDPFNNRDPSGGSQRKRGRSRIRWTDGIDPAGERRWRPALRLKSPFISLRLTLQERKAPPGASHDWPPNPHPPTPLIWASIEPEQMAPRPLWRRRRLNNRTGEDDEADPDSSTSTHWEPGGHMLFVSPMRSRRPRFDL